MKRRTYSSPEERWQAQIELENEMLHSGVHQFRRTISEAKSDGSFADTAPGRRLTEALIDPVAEAFADWQAENFTTRGFQVNIYPLLQDADPVHLAWIALRGTISTVVVMPKRGGNWTAIAKRTGQQIEAFLRAEAWMKSNPAYFHQIQRRLDEDGSTAVHRERVNRVAMTKTFKTWTRWTDDECIRVGSLFMDFLCKTGHFVLDRTDRNGLQFMPAAGTITWLDQAIDSEAIYRPHYYPTLIPPKRWTGMTGGGYHTGIVAAPNLIMGWKKIDDLPQMPNALTALNTVQETAWRVNHRVLEVAAHLWERDHAVAGLPPRASEPEPQRPPESAPEDGEEWKEWRKKARAVHKRNHRAFSQINRTRQTINMATRFVPEPTIYFPHRFDFRGRIYSFVTGLSTQGTDLAKGLLEFANGQHIRLETWGYHWLMVHAANMWGCDKQSMKERLTWYEDNVAMILNIAEDPLMSTEWHQADAPFQFLATCFAIHDYLGGREVHLPIQVDGTCNGLQHLSAMSLDEVTGAAVNLTPGAVPRDIYTEIGGKVPGYDRKSVKGSIMTIPYSRTLRGFCEDAKKALKKRGDYKDWAQALAMGRALWAEANRSLKLPMKTMAWLKAVARAAAYTGKDGIEVAWTTPTGFLVRHRYRKMNSRTLINWINGTRHRHKLKDEDKTKLDRRKIAASIAANFVHSYDAAALVETILIAYPLTDFLVIHDAFGTHANDMHKLSVAIREAFIYVHSENALEQLAKECTIQGVTGMPPLPERGDLNLEDVRHSTYFFG